MKGVRKRFSASRVWRHDVTARARRRGGAWRAHVTEETYPMWHLENVVRKE